MPDLHVLEDSTVKLRAKLVSGVSESQAVKFILAQTGGGEKIDPTEAEVPLPEGDAAVHEVKLPKVADAEPGYDLAYGVEAEGESYMSSTIYKVWPKTLEFVAKDADGKPFEGVPFFVEYPMGGAPLDGDAPPPLAGLADVSELLKTNAEGKHVFHHTFKGEAVVRVLSPYEVQDKEAFAEQQGRVREATVVRRPYKAMIEKPAGVAIEDARTHRQYVNMAAADGDNCGSRLAVTIKPDNPDLAMKGDKLFVQVEFGEKNSKRNDPKPCVVKKGAPGAGGKPAIPERKIEPDDTRLVKLTPTLAADKGSYEFEIELGYAGGDTFTIRSGVTEACEDDSVVVTNWRKLNYEIMAPEAMQFDDKNVGGATKKDWVAAMAARMKTCNDAVFLEFALSESHSFTTAEAPKGAVMKRKYFGMAPADDDIYVLTDWSFTQYPKPMAKADSRAIYFKPCELNYYNTAGATSHFPNMASKTLTWTIPGGDEFLPVSANEASGGGDALTHVKWKALVDPAAHPDHPGVDGGAAREGELDVAACVEFVDSTHIKIKLPTANDDDPGKFVGAATTATQCKIRLDIKLELAVSALGLSGQGAQSGEILLVYVPSSPNCSADTLLHEVGHSCGLTVYNGWYKPPKGLGYPTTTDADDADTGAKGHAYDNAHGDSGSHCAFGLSDAEKGQADYESIDSGTCIMFGHGPSTDPSKATSNFCDECTTFFKARDLRVILGKDFNA